MQWYKNLKIARVQPRRLFRPISQIGAQRNMVGFVVEGHIYVHIPQHFNILPVAARLQLTITKIQVHARLTNV